MKKIMFGLGAALALVACADIESSNVVGYQMADCAKNTFYIFAPQFENCAGSMKIADLISGIEGVDWDSDDTWLSTAAQIQVPANGAYTTYRFINDGWFDDGSEEGAYKPGWVNADAEITDDEFVPGVSVWFKVPSSAANMTIAGQVPSIDSQSISCPNNMFCLRGNPYPVDFCLNDETKVTFEGLKGVDWDSDDEWLSTATQIQVPSEGAYVTYRYINDGWYDDGSEEGAYKPGWVNADAEIVDVKIPAGQGFWVKGTQGEFTMTFKK